MSSVFRSVFSQDIQGFFEFRESLGFTTENAVKYLHRFDSFCLERPPENPVLTKQVIDAWLESEQSKGYIDMAGRSSAIRLLGKYLCSLGREAYIMPSSYCRTKSTFVPYILSQKELSAFFQAADELEKWHVGDPFAPNVAPVIFRLMYTSGLRPQEACNLVDDDVNLSTGEILIRVNKRKKQRIIVVSDDMLQLLNEYVVQRTKIFVRTPYFFPRVDGSKYNSQRLGALCDRCWQAANPTVEKQNLPRLRPYDFRHSCASSVLQKWLDEGVDLYTMLPYLRAYMGHEHFDDTAYYIHVLPERLVSSAAIDWEAIDASAPEVTIWD